MSVNFIPAGYHTITPYLIVKGAAAAIDFYKWIFDAVEIMRMPGPDGAIMHAELRIGDSKIMLGEESPIHPGPQTLGGSPVGLCVYFPDVDARFSAAVAAGATVVREVKDQFYGDRTGAVTDPFGHNWTLSTHIEDVSDEEMGRRFEAMMKAMPAT
jgi:PhnB protein